MKKYISIILGIIYFPIYLVGFVLYCIAGLLLALAYTLTLNGRKAKDIITNMFHPTL